MNDVKVNFSEVAGKVKPLHAVNNGPVYKWAPNQRITNIDAWKEAGIPYARLHDSAFYSTYGGEHIVDVHMIFPDFDKDPYDEASYDFDLTDIYLKVIESAGTKIFYRLGSKIEHSPKKYGTLPPRDFKKWAVICEHIIRHYTMGWANGFYMDIEYWEIWNEPDEPDGTENKLCWSGNEAQFFEFFNVAAKHLKETFPKLKIGGPALGGRLDWAERFLAQLETKIDFFSWHAYGYEPDWSADKAVEVRRLLDKYGFTETESILDEWNYVKGWRGEEWYYSLKQEKSLKGASYIAGLMCLCQYIPLDMLMYYDARPCGMNGMFNTDFVCELLKGYYPFKMFNELYKLGSAVKAESGHRDIYVCAAKGEDKAAVMLTHFNDDVNTEAKKVKLSALGFMPGRKVRVSCFVLDEERDLELFREEVFTGESYSLVLDMALYSSCLIIIEKEEDN